MDTHSIIEEFEKQSDKEFEKKYAESPFAGSSAQVKEVMRGWFEAGQTSGMKYALKELRRLGAGSKTV